MRRDAATVLSFQPSLSVLYVRHVSRWSGSPDFHVPIPRPTAYVRMGEKNDHSTVRMPPPWEGGGLAAISAKGEQ